LASGNLGQRRSAARAVCRRLRAAGARCREYLASTATRCRRWSVLDLDGCRLINPALASDDLAASASDPIIRQAFRDERLIKFLATSTGSSDTKSPAVLLATPLSIDLGEVTDKGSINQRRGAGLSRGLIDELYSPTPPAHVITL